MLEHVLAQYPELDFIPPAAKTWLGPFSKPLMRAFKLHKLFTMYDNMEDRPSTPQKFAEEVLRMFDVQVDVKGDGLNEIPEKGPLVVVSNHPFGAIEGVVLFALLKKYRPDTQVLANFILGCIPELSEAVIQVDPFDSETARRNNIKGLREAISHVSDGGCLVVFPAGEVSHLQPRLMGIMDPKWNRNVARIIRKTNADVLPLYFDGRNSMFFNLVGLVHPFLRTALLPAELLKKRKSKITLNAGRIIPGSLLNGSNGLTSERDVTTYLRARSYSLRKGKGRHSFSLPFTKAPKEQPIAMPRPVSSLDVDLEELPQDQILVRESGYTVFEAKAFQIPNMLHELGRLREITFRGVGEGSGRELDLDAYDYEYDHLILWNDADRCIAGAYRLGNVPAIMKTSGKKGLYCSSLFSFKPAFFHKYSNSVELGRALVAQDYQRDYAPLMLLWKGIGQYLRRRPELRYLFGPCSLPLTFSPYSLETITDYLTHHYGDAQVSETVQGRKAPKWKTPKGINERIDPDTLSYNGLNRLVKDMEGVGLPILFKHYLKLGGTIANYHVDSSFGTVDAFLLIDLAKAPHKTVARYMGKDAAARFLPAATSAE